MMWGNLGSRAYEAALRAPIPRSRAGTHPGGISLVQNVATPSAPHRRHNMSATSLLELLEDSMRTRLIPAIWLESRKRGGSVACREEGCVGGSHHSFERSAQGLHG